jgi:hypothetical protein
MKKTFEIKISLQRLDESGKTYFEIIPDNEYQEKVKHCLLIEESELSLDSVKEILFNLLVEMYGSEFTDKFEM